MTEPIYSRQHLRHAFTKGAHSHGLLEPVLAEIGDRLTDRLLDTKRRFATALDVGAGTGTLARHLPAAAQPETLVQLDISAPLLQQASGLRIQADMEADLPFADSCFDLVLSNLALVWANNPPRLLLQLGRLLRPDGLLLVSTLGQGSLTELQQAFAASGSPYPHVLPLADVQSAGAALQKVGFAMPVVDRDTLTLEYSSFANMYADLQALGPTNLHPARRRGLLTPRALARMEDAYRDMFARPDGSLPLTLEILYLHGWRPHHSQQKPLAPGTSKINLQDVLNTLPPQKTN